jgi:hypothetical protein
MKKSLIFIFLSSVALSNYAYEEKCVGPLDPKAMYKIAVPFEDGKYDYSYNKVDPRGKKFTCFVKVTNTSDAIDFVATKPVKERFEWLKQYLKK